MYYIISGMRFFLTVVLSLMLILGIIDLLTNLEVIYGLKEIAELFLVIIVLNYFEGKYEPKSGFEILKEISENAIKDKRVKLDFCGFQWKSIFNY